MVQGMSVSTLTTSRVDSVYASAHVWRSNFGLMKKSQIMFGVERQCLWYQWSPSISFMGQSDMLSQRNWRAEAGWLFKGGDQDLDASSERSESANEDILFLVYQLDLATQIQVWLAFQSLTLYVCVCV